MLVLHRLCTVIAKWSLLIPEAESGVPSQRRRSGATRRVDSSLRSHRTRWSYCHRVYSGLNKTLFASIGPNLPCRGHQLRCPATPGRASTVEEQRCQLGRIKPGRGRRLDGMSPTRWLAPTQGIRRIPPHVVDSFRSRRLLSVLTGALAARALLAAALRLRDGPARYGLLSRTIAYRRHNSRRPWPCWPCL